MPSPGIVVPKPTGFPFASTKGKLAALTGVPVPEVPPDPKAPLLPTLNGPSSQSNPSSFRLFCVISTNLDSISTCFGTATFACSTNASTRSKLSCVLRTIRRLLSGRKFALAPSGNGTPWLSRNSFAPSRFTSCWPPVDSWVSLPVPAGSAVLCAVL